MPKVSVAYDVHYDDGTSISEVNEFEDDDEMSIRETIASSKKVRFDKVIITAKSYV